MFEFKVVCGKCGESLRHWFSNVSYSGGSGVIELKCDPHVCGQDSHINLSTDEREKHIRCSTCRSMDGVCNSCMWFPFLTDNWRK